MKCLICGDEFAPYRSNGMFCSPECRKVNKKNTRTNTFVQIGCSNCGESITVTLSDYNRTIKNGHNKFCSAICFNRYGKTMVKCDCCNKDLWLTNSQLKRSLYHYCSKICAEDDSRYHLRDNSHQRWKGGGIYLRGKNWAAIRKAVRDRDGHKCMICGMTEKELGKAMDVHHIVPYRLFKNDEEANDLGNLISLCPSCHHREDARVKE